MFVREFFDRFDVASGDGDEQRHQWCEVRDCQKELTCQRAARYPELAVDPWGTGHHAAARHVGQRQGLVAAICQ